MISTLDLLIGFSKVAVPFPESASFLIAKYQIAKPIKTATARPPIAIPAMAPAPRPLLLLLEAGTAVGAWVGDRGVVAVITAKNR